MRNRTKVFMAAIIAFVFFATMAVAAEEFSVYPSKGQNKEQIEKDKFACYQWAKEQTGYDPMQAPTAAAPPPSQKGGAVRGGARGALAGAAIGAIAGDAGKGAAIGAAAGGMAGGARQRRSNEAQESQAQQQAASAEQQRSKYNKAWCACLEGKGYSVK